ncbi:protein disulfide-isomerase A5, partial [Tachysurus ichikawai]
MSGMLSYECCWGSRVQLRISSNVLAGMNVHPAEFDGLKQEYDVKGYPTFCYIEKGKFLYHYENYGATAKDIADWLK